MKKSPTKNRRQFLKACSLSAVPILLPTSGLSAMGRTSTPNQGKNQVKTPINFISDGLFLSPNDYLQQLQEINKKQAIEADFYGNGGAVKVLEEEFVKLTGKEKAIYLPSGTMANQLAIKLLNGNNTKVMVPENSHIFRDEADAAQSVHNQRLIPLGKGKAHFELSDLKDSIQYLNSNEVFRSGLGTIAIENPIRRADGSFIPLENIQAIANYAQEQGFKMHLDGARIHIASAYSRVSIQDYASHFDTVYISLYKYLNAAGGAILCGPATLIDQISHYMKILGGTVYQNWYNAAMALHYLEGVEERWQQTVARASQLINDLNEMEGVQVSSLKNGTNIYDLQLSDAIELKALANYLYENHNIWLGRANKEGIVKLMVNESLLTRSHDEVIVAWQKGLKKARK